MMFKHIESSCVGTWPAGSLKVLSLLIIFNVWPALVCTLLVSRHGCGAWRVTVTTVLLSSGTTASDFATLLLWLITPERYKVVLCFTKMLG